MISVICTITGANKCQEKQNAGGGKIMRKIDKEIAGRMTQAEKNLLLLQEMIPSNEQFCLWCFHPDGSYIAVSCTDYERDLLLDTFRMFQGIEKLQEYAQSEDNIRPVIIGSPIGMQWALSYEAERNRSLIFVIGPVFYAAPDKDQLRTALQPYIKGHDDADWAAALCEFLPSLPVMSYTIFSRYVMMVHNALTGQQLGFEALSAVSPDRQENRQAPPAGERNRSEVYLSERALLQMVKNGDINYHSVLQNSARLSPGVPVQGKDPLRQVKTSLIVFTTLVSRAAIEGGLSPEIAYSLGDSYIQSVEDCRDSGELNALAHAMYHDFVSRVHQLHTAPGCSHAIRKCCDYIELNLDQKIRASDLAALVGYTEYYLTEKFKKETGLSVSTYIRQAKIERAKVLLESSGMSVGEIAEQLAFNTVNYFIQCFRDLTGFSPAQYRKQCRSSMHLD